MFHGGRQHDHPPLVVDLLGEFPAPLRRVSEKLAEHENHILVSVVVVVPENDVVAGLPTGAVVGALALLCRGGILLDRDGNLRVGLGGGGLG